MNTNAILNKRIRRLNRAEAILNERDRQDTKWGTPQNHTLPEWMVILMEEVGELADAVSARIFPVSKSKKDWRKEAVQVAAVALAMLEQYENKTKELPPRSNDLPGQAHFTFDESSSPLVDYRGHRKGHFDS